MPMNIYSIYKYEGIQISQGEEEEEREIMPEWQS